MVPSKQIQTPKRAKGKPYKSSTKKQDLYSNVQSRVKTSMKKPEAFPKRGPNTHKFSKTTESIEQSQSAIKKMIEQKVKTVVQNRAQEIDLQEAQRAEIE